MNKKIKYCFIWQVVFLFLSATQSYAADVKLYIATNKQQYSPAEFVQFQVFLLNAANTNNTVYVELLDCKGNLLDKKMLPIIAGTSGGNMELPNTSAVEFYILYCYIIDKDTVQTEGSKKLFIDNKNAFLLPGKSKGPGINIFTEGGGFVAEMPNNLLISYRDENGNPAPANIKIVDDKNILLDSFSVDESGYLKIIFAPEFKARYFILLKDEKGTEIKKELPPSTEYGVVFSVIASRDSLLYTVDSYMKNQVQLDYKLNILSNNETVYKADINFQQGLSMIKEVLLLKDLPTGFLTFRLTDNNSNLVAQRTFYNEQRNTESGVLKIVDTISKRSATINIPGFTNGGGYLNLTLKDEKNKNPNPPGSNNIQDFSEQPVITNVTGNEISFNDMLIAWPKPSFKPVIVKDDGKSFLTLSGTVYDLEKKIIKNKKINLIIAYKNSKKDYLVTSTDHKGNFEVSSLIFYDTALVYCQQADNSDDKNNIQVDLKLSPSSSVNGNELKNISFLCASEQISATDTAVINNNIYNSNNTLKPGEKTLKEVTVKGAKTKTETDKFVEENVSGQHNQGNFKRNEFDFIANPQLIDNTSLFAFLRGRFNLIIDITAKGGIRMSNTAGDPLGVYLNDMDVTEDLSIVSNLFVYDLALIRYYSFPLKPRSNGTKTKFGYSVGNGGDLMIYTKKGFTPGEQMAKGLVKNKIAGYDMYKSLSPQISSTVDQQCLYWKPNWSFQKQETIYIGLPPAQSKNVELTIEGINKNNIPFSFTKKVIFN